MAEEGALPAAVPMIAYENGPAAMDWLSEAFGFVERQRMVDDGRLSHGEMTLGHGVVMMATPSPDYESPRHHREHCEAAAAWSKVPYVINGVLMTVPDLDAHYGHAKAAGATILSDPAAIPGGRAYRAEDLEGHRRMFMQPT